MPLSQQQSSNRGFVVVQGPTDNSLRDSSVLSMGQIDLESSFGDSKKNKIIRKKVIGNTPRTSLVPTNDPVVDDQAILKYRVAIYRLKKIANAKLIEKADPGAKRDYLTRIKVFACFVRIGEIGEINFEKIVSNI